MDPNATLNDLLALAAEVLDNPDNLGNMPDDTDTLVEMSELVQALDGWISSGGFLPEKWRR
jgi:hypothetical protein